MTGSAGTPGTWAPPEATPADLAALQSSHAAASPTTAWLPGQHIVTGDGQSAYWNGNAWRLGVAPPVITQPTSGASVTLPFTITGLAQPNTGVTILLGPAPGEITGGVGSTTADSAGAFSLGTGTMATGPMYLTPQSAGLMGESIPITVTA